MSFELFDVLSELSPIRETGNLHELEPGVTLEHVGTVSELTEFGNQSDWIVGNPEHDTENWHKQTEKNSCAISCQEFVAEQLLDKEFSEKDLISYAEKNGWYSEETGTTASDVGKLLESLGLEVERTSGLSLNDLADEIDSGGKLICGVSNMILANPEFADLPGYKANHAVEVIGIDASNLSDIQVILNDPGLENGKGVRIPSDTFLKAWKTSGNYTVIARKGGIL